MPRQFHAHLRSLALRSSWRARAQVLCPFLVAIFPPRRERARLATALCDGGVCRGRMNLPLTEPRGILLPLTVSAPTRLCSKTRGLGAGRKMRLHRKEQRWADKDFRKAHQGKEYAKPFAGCSHAKGIVLEKIGIEAKQPNSAIRKCARVQLIKNGKKIAAFVPNDGMLNFIDENDEVLIAGFGRRGHAVGDIPGVRFKVVKVSGVSLIALFREKKEKPRS